MNTRALRRRVARLEASSVEGSTEFWIEADGQYMAPGGRPVTEAEFHAATKGAPSFTLTVDTSTHTLERIEAARRGELLQPGTSTGTTH